ncbi:MAG: hypothetical protein ACTSR2_13135, partial [Candidatus Hodarchaeales archaeon]
MSKRENNNLKERVLLELNPELIGKIDVLVEKKLYANRKAFLEKAIEAQLNIHQETF